MSLNSTIGNIILNRHEKSRITPIDEINGGQELRTLTKEALDNLALAGIGVAGDLVFLGEFMWDGDFMDNVRAALDDEGCDIIPLAGGEVEGKSVRAGEVITDDLGRKNSAEALIALMEAGIPARLDRHFMIPAGRGVVVDLPVIPC